MSTDNSDLEYNGELIDDSIFLKSLSSDSEYNCSVTVHFFEKNFTKDFKITTDYDGKYNAYFCFTFHIFLEKPIRNSTLFLKMKIFVRHYAQPVSGSLPAPATPISCPLYFWTIVTIVFSFSSPWLRPAVWSHSLLHSEINFFFLRERTWLNVSRFQWIIS